MAQLTVQNLASDLVRRLKIRAARNNRSTEAEHRAILEEALMREESAFWERAARLRGETRHRPTTVAAALIREDRDRDLLVKGPPEMK